ncbi:hypothetical protein JCM10212_006019 [Sporobolomyces blumeae]
MDVHPLPPLPFPTTTTRRRISPPSPTQPGLPFPSRPPTHAAGSSRGLFPTTHIRRPRTAPAAGSPRTIDSFAPSRPPTGSASPLPPTPLHNSSKPLPRIGIETLANDLSSFRMASAPVSPVSPTFPSRTSHSTSMDPISPLDSTFSPPSAPSFPRKVRSYRSDSSPSDDDNALRSSLRARSAIVDYNCFDIDFSFLEDEPPTASSARSHRRDLSSSSSSTQSSAEDDLVDRRSSGLAFPANPRRSMSRNERLSSSSSLPFPSRPSFSRQESAESTATRKSSAPSIRSQTDRPRLSNGLPSSVTAANRLSLASFVSSELSPGEQPRRTSSIAFPGRPSGYFDFADRRKRLATFLDRTAEAMEGGKSLPMVLPETRSNRPLSQYVGSGSPVESSYSFDTSAGQHNVRQSVYYTPRAPDQSPDVAQSEDQHELRLPPLSSPSEASAGTGLGFGASLDSQEKRSPATLRASSPGGFSGATRTVESERDERDKADDEKKVKVAEKRRRTIRELVDTESTYAVDMMVVRDIYLARARGAHMTQIADYVMSTGLGLGVPNLSASAAPLASSASSTKLGRSGGRPSSSGGRSDALRQSFSSATQPNLTPGQPLMSAQDIHVVFANLEEIAALAESFASQLDAAAGGDDDGREDRIGEVFVEMIPRIQKTYSTYCVRHHRAIVRLQDLEPSLRSYLSECKTLSHGRTNAWDLASLLIKPVQRCLKYPLLLDQILSATPEDHPDYAALKRANTDMLVVADAINESKKRSETVARIVSKDKNGQRRESTKSISSMGTTVTKKLLRTSQKAKGIFGDPVTGGDEIFDTLVALVDSTRSAVLRFSNEMRDWTRTTKAALEAQVTMVEGWIDLYAPMAGEYEVSGGPHHRLCVFLDETLIPIIEGPWRELDDEVRRSLILKTDHLLSLFENPRQVIAKRNDKLLDHHRYLAKKLPSDRKGSEDFMILSSQLLEELPRFLGSVSRYFNIIVAHFAGAQAAYNGSVQQRWADFADQWIGRSPGGGLERSVEQLHAAAHQPVAQIMDSLAAGLGIAVTQSASSGSKRHSSRLSRPSSSSGASSKPTPPLYRRASSSDHRLRHRQSSTSMSSFPSSNDPTTPQIFPSAQVGAASPKSTARVSYMSSDSYSPYDRRSLSLRCDGPLPTVPGSTNGSCQATPLADSPAKLARGLVNSDVSEHRLSTASYPVDAYATVEHEEYSERDGPLYVAEAIASSQSNAFRSGYPILSFEVGERLSVELEEADRAEGGSGWLLGRKVAGDDHRLGWVRTEDFAMVGDDEDDEDAVASRP